MSEKQIEKSLVDGALSDLAIAFEQVSEIDKISHANTRTKKLAAVAAMLIENGFDRLATYGSPATVTSLRNGIESAKNGTAL